MTPMKPPVEETGIFGWIRSNLFNGAFNAIITLAIAGLLWQVVPPLLRWVFVDAVWFTGPEACRECGGACWSVVSENIRFILFGFYPYEHQWRPMLAMGLFTALVLASLDRGRWNKRLGYAWIVGFPVMAVLLSGGIAGLSVVETSQWGGLPLTLMLAVFGMVAAYPLGVLLALGRQSEMGVLKSICVVYIEMIRGVPLISVLFMSSIMFPLFLPEGVSINKILRAQVAIILFFAAYIAEAVRGGLQAVARGQYEAADALGLNYYQTMRVIILPQALKIVIPPTVNILITAFKDTSLVVIIALFDVLMTTKTVIANPTWMGFSTEAYVFVALVYFVCCYAMSRYSRRLEEELDTG